MKTTQKKKTTATESEVFTPSFPFENWFFKGFWGGLVWELGRAGLRGSYTIIYMGVSQNGGTQQPLGFPTKNDHFGVFWGYHHFRKHPYNYLIVLMDWVTHLSHVTPVWGQYFDQWLSARWSVRQSVRESGGNWRKKPMKLKSWYQGGVKHRKAFSFRFRFCHLMMVRTELLDEIQLTFWHRHTCLVFTLPFIMVLIHGGIPSLIFSLDFFWTVGPW